MRISNALFPALLVALGGLSTRLDPAPSPAAPLGADNGWSIRLDAGKPYFAPGETLRGFFELYNGSSQDAHGFVPVKGGNGCDYRITLRDASGALVWEPGSLVGGQYQGPGCLFGAQLIALYAGGTSHRRQFAFPLVYQNGAGVGTLGAPLPPDTYLLRADVYFAGPNHAPGSAASGFSFAAEVPLRIEP